MDLYGIGAAAGSIRLNQVGYRPGDEKTAFVVSEDRTFTVYDLTKKPVYIGRIQDVPSGFDGSPRIDVKSGDILGKADFSSVREEGSYYIASGDEKSPVFRIGTSIYRELTAAVLKMFYYQRCGGEGILPEFAGSVFAHEPCHKGPAVYYDGSDPVYGKVSADVSGGWHDAGDYGRYVTPAAKAVADLLLTYEYFPSIADIDFGGPVRLLDEVRYELEWMLKMQEPRTGAVFHKVTTQAHANMAWLPENDPGQLYLSPVSAQAAGDFAAAMALASRIYGRFDGIFADTCINAALKAWKWLENNPEANEYKDPPFFRTGAYNDVSAQDERWWAAAELYRTTGNRAYLKYLSETPLPKLGFGWAEMGSYGMVSVLAAENIDHGSELYRNVKEHYLKEADRLISLSRKDGYGISLENYAWGSNMDVANNAMTMLIAGSISPDEKYFRAALDHFHYLMGRNTMGVSYVTDFGEYAASHPHHRPSMIQNQAVPGMLVGGPFGRVWSLERDPASKLFGENTPPAKCYADIWESFSTNEVCIYWNSPLVFILGWLGECG